MKKRNDEKVRLQKKKTLEQAKLEAQEKHIAANAESKTKSQLKRKLLDSSHWLVGVETAERQPMVCEIAGDVEARKMSSGGKLYDEPFLLVSSETVSRVVDDKSGEDKPGYWIAKWHFD